MLSTTEPFLYPTEYFVRIEEEQQEDNFKVADEVLKIKEASGENILPQQDRSRGCLEVQVCVPPLFLNVFSQTLGIVISGVTHFKRTQSPSLRSHQI